MSEATIKQRGMLIAEQWREEVVQFIESTGDYGYVTLMLDLADKNAVTIMRVVLKLEGFPEDKLDECREMWISGCERKKRIPAFVISKDHRFVRKIADFAAPDLLANCPQDGKLYALIFTIGGVVEVVLNAKKVVSIYEPSKN